jgi:probable DNA repair protein
MNGRLRQYVEDGFTVVTAGARLARRLHYAYARECLQRGRGAWETPDILSFDAWLERCWREPAGADTTTGPGAQLLRRAQAEHLWLDIISHSRFRARLLQPAAVAHEAAQAWDTLQQWCAPPFPDELHLNEDARAFAAWMRAFRERCAAERWIDAASLGAVLLTRWRAVPPPAARIAFIGFDATTPIQEALCATLRKAGWGVEWIHGEERGARVAVAGFADRRAEIAAAAAWIRAQLADDARLSIGVVVPHLRPQRRMVEEIFDDVLEPGSLLDAGSGAPRPYSIAPGEPLAASPVVAAALSALSLGRRHFPLSIAGALLRSPFLMPSPEETADLARVDARLRRRGGSLCSLRSLIQAADASGRGRDAPPAVAARLRRIGAVLDALPRVQSPRGWAASFSNLLTAAAWPGGRTLNSAEYQAAEAWRETLDDFAALDVFGETWGLDSALSTLARLAMEDFQPRTGETPVQVLGMEGAADMGFDRLWVTGLEEETWPPAARPSPFLPLRMQRELDMPRATPESALRHARTLTRRLASCADEVIFSFPQNEAETPLRASPLLRALSGTAEAPGIEMPDDYLRQVFASRVSEVFVDDRATAVGCGGPTRGGAALLRDQAACPFRAFARHRLAARPVDAVDIGLSARERGKLVHAVLEAIWHRLGDHATLVRASDAELDELIAAASSGALETLRQRRPETVTARFAEVEGARLRGLMRGWLQLERLRKPFIVEAREQEREARIADLQLRLRVDRVDRLADGRKLILDYKTGEAGPDDWFGARPDDPQLPLYAVTSGETVAALGFARVRPRRHAFAGLAESAGLVPGLETPAGAGPVAGGAVWPELLNYWRRSLEDLAAAFRTGDARVDPKNAQACRECDLHAFCRIHESQPWLEAFDE